MSEVNQFSAAEETCRFCHRPPRHGWNEEAIFGPVAPDGFRQVIGWAHPRCLRRETASVLEQLSSFTLAFRGLPKRRASELRAEVDWLRERLDAGANITASVTHLMRRMVAELSTVKVPRSRRYRLSPLLQRIEAIQFLSRETFACEIPLPRPFGTALAISIGP